MVRKTGEKTASDSANEKLRAVMKQLRENTHALRQMVERLREITDHSGLEEEIFRAQINGRQIVCAHQAGEMPRIRLRRRGFDLTTARHRFWMTGNVIHLNDANYGSCSPEDCLELSLDGVLLVNGVRRDPRTPSRLRAPDARRRVGRMPIKSFRAASNGLPSLRG